MGKEDADADTRTGTRQTRVPRMLLVTTTWLVLRTSVSGMAN
jgi:hypothetical protein